MQKDLSIYLSILLKKNEALRKWDETKERRKERKLRGNENRGETIKKKNTKLERK